MSRAVRFLLAPLIALLFFFTASAASAQIPAVGDLPLPDGPPPAPTEGGTAPEPPTQSQASSAAPLVGTFRITAGDCASNRSGSFFRMIQPGGTATGPFVTNSDSPCGDKSYTPLRPGSD